MWWHQYCWKVPRLNIPAKEGPTVLVPHQLLSPCTLARDFSIGENSEFTNLFFLGLSFGIVKDTTPFQFLRPTWDTFLAICHWLRPLSDRWVWTFNGNWGLPLAMPQISIPCYRLKLAIKVLRFWTSVVWCPGPGLDLFGKLIGFPSRIRWRLFNRQR